MKFQKNVVLGLAVISVLSSCGSNKDGWEPYPGKAASAPAINISKDFRQEEKNHVSEVFEFLQTVWIKDEHSGQFKKTAVLSGSDPQSLVNWLETRVKHLVQPDGVEVREVQANGTEKSVYRSGSAQSDGVLAANAGIAIYNGTEMHKADLRARSQKAGIPADPQSTFKLRLSGIGDFPVRSQYDGVITLHSLFFRHRKNSKVREMHHLSTLVHEAVHSDGNGKSLGFFHVKCPVGHDMHGDSYACDNNANGPYTVEAEFIHAFRKSCNGCSRAELGELEMVELDARSRSVSDEIWDHSPEKKVSNTGGAKK